MNRKCIASSFGRKVMLLTLVFSTVFFSVSQAIDLPPVTQVIRTTYPSGTPVTIGTPAAESEVDFTPKTGAFDDDVRNFITLAVDWNYPGYVGSSATTSVRLEVETFDAADVSMGLTYVDLEVEYNPFTGSSSRDKQRFAFTDVYRFTVKIIEINGISSGTLPANLYIESQIDVRRHYHYGGEGNTPLVFNSPVQLDIDNNSTPDEILVSWNPLFNAMHYQLEWTHVNDYSATGTPLAMSALAFDFKHNSTRIETKGTSYRIPMLFDRGYVLFRVRAFIEGDTYLFGVWNAPDAGSNASVVTTFVYVATAHEHDKNWQVTTTFAEEGKKKEVISYFDGSLRSRQTVTRLNTDENVIVGETIYDYQGRPAVTVLPAPVEKIPDYERALQYYEAFNVNGSSNPYSPEDFDEDAGGCGVSAGTMGTEIGASAYYSQANPDKSGFQSYVPDAKGYPFVQVEYTPDNTGRIRRQGGAGETFQLGSGHETKYFYGQPNQPQLDRLFGSEVGYAAHYKKNVVIDPNGQVSVSYLDQEGRVIATSLAGDATPGLDALPSEAAAAVEFTIDLFSADPNGVSLLNVPSNDSNAMVFSTQMLVPYAGNYEFAYEFTVGPYTDPCLEQDVCFSCVYEMEIHIIDECGVDYAQESGQPVKRVVGQFTLDQNDQIVFSTECNGDYELAPPYTQEVYLPVGSYTVSKVLHISQDAIDFYVATYLDPEYNTCALTLEDFTQGYMNQLDYSGCEIDCQDCLDNLGERDAFIAQGRGTSADYDLLYAECKSACKMMESWCEITYRQLLGDVQPGGQYAQYQETSPGVASAGTYPLSVLNTSNVLPYNVSPGSGNWKNPQTEYQGVTYPHYLNENGSIATVTVLPDGANYIPAVSNVLDVFLSTDGVTLLTYPENLLHLNDFIALFRPEWAAGLVRYHPEYCYYEKCRIYGETHADDILTSDDFDSRMLFTHTWNDAVSEGFIVANYASQPNAISRLGNIGNTASIIYDPFVTNAGLIGSTFIANFGWRFMNYIEVSGTPHNALEAAAISARCPYPGTPISSDCLDFGLDVVGYSPAQNDSLRDVEWNIAKNFYLSLKRQIQDSIADAYARTSCYGLNHCIGNNDEYNPFTSQMLNLPGPLTFLAQPYFSPAQPCGGFTRELYSNKQVRFVRAVNVPMQETNYVDAGYQVYLQTGMCPTTYASLQLINQMAEYGKLTATNESLLGYPAYTSFYLAAYNYTPPVSITSDPIEWDASQPSADELIVSLSNSGGPIGSTSFDKSGLSISWSDIKGFTAIRYGMGSNTTFAYPAQVKAKIVQGGITTYEWLDISLTAPEPDCVFPERCEPNDFARDVMMLTSALAHNGDFIGANISLEAPGNYSPFVTNRIRNMLGTPNNDLEWDFDPMTNLVRIYDVTNPTQYISFQMMSTDPSGFSSGDVPLIKSFTNIKSAYQHLYTVEARDVAGNFMVEFTAAVTHFDGVTERGVSMGKCALPQPMSCQGTPFDLTEDLEEVLKERVVRPSFAAAPNLGLSPYYSMLLQSYLGFNTSGTYTPDNTGPDYHERIDINSETCGISLYTQTTTSGLHLDEVIAIGDIIIYGEPEADNYFHQFKMVAVFQVGMSEVTDTIFGYSCLPLAKCTLCDEEPEPLMRRMEVRQTEQKTGPDGTARKSGAKPELQRSMQREASAPILPDPCENAYEEYSSLVRDYNRYAKEGGLPAITNVYDQETFIREGFCYCLDGYFANLYAYVAGLYEPLSVTEMLDIGKYCEDRLTPPCTPEPYVFDGSTDLPPADYENPCQTQLEDNAKLNGEAMYQQYVEYMTTVIASAYRKHCLGAAETFTTVYTDKEYHFTLYYYDQAGNLVKTVPPEGVRMLDITSHTSPDAIQVANDRLNGTHTIYTHHQLPTTYRYNSLNQLEQQSLPDHDKMSVWQTSLSVILEPGMTVTDVQFVNGQQGYLTGYYTPAGGSQARGLMYRTNDGGATWQRVNDLLGVTLNKIQMVDANVGYAVGERGIVLKTTNGGGSWDMLNTHEHNVEWNLWDLHFVDANTGVLVGSGITTYGGISILVTGGGTGFTFGLFPSSSYTSGGYFRVTSVTYDAANSQYVAVARHKLTNSVPEFGRVFYSNDGVNWIEHSGYTNNDLYALTYVDGEAYFVAGISGTQAGMDASGGYSFHVPTNLTGTVRDVYCLNTTEGVAIVEDNPGEGLLYKTNNGGQHWELLGDDQHYYTGFNMYTTGKLLATGRNGLVHRILLETGQPFGIVALNNYPGSQDVHGSFGAMVGTKVPVLVGGNGGQLYYSRDAQMTVPVWTSVPTSVLSSDNAIRKIAGRTIGTNPNSFSMSAVLLTDQGNLYGVFKSTGNAFTLSAVSAGGAEFADVVYATGESYALAIEKNTGVVYVINLPSGGPASSATAISSSSSYTNFTRLTYRNTGTIPEVVVIGEAGVVLQGELNNFSTPTSLLWTDMTENLYPHGFADVEYEETSGDLYAVAGNGRYYVKSSGLWREHALPERTEMHTAALHEDGNYGLIGGAQGRLYRIDLSTQSVETLVSGVTETIFDLETVGDIAAASCGGGMVFSTPDMRVPSPIFTAISTTVTTDIRGLSYRPTSGEVLTVGQQSHIQRVSMGAVALRVTQIFTPPLNAVHFADAARGYTVGDNFTVRYTSDGGATWRAILPATLNIPSPLPAFKGVYTHTDGTGVFVGNDGFIYSASAGAAQPQIRFSSLGINLNDVAFVNPLEGFAVGGNGTNARVYYTSNGGTGWTPVTAFNTVTGEMNALRTFPRNNSFLAVGNNGQMIYGNNSGHLLTYPSAVTSGTSEDLQDLFFHDDLNGYIVGTGGTLLRSDGFTLDGSLNYASGSWIPLPVNDGLAGQTVTTDMDIRTIAFYERFKGFMGGAYAVNSEYHRRIHDESGIYSTRYWYDRLGRLILSQNTKQHNASPKRYSYTLYDALGRVYEVGEKEENATGDNFTSIFGTLINNHYNPETIDESRYLAWIDEAGARREVTQTYYDRSYAVSDIYGMSQENLRKRIAIVTYEEEYDANDSTYDQATYYSYDIHGNVAKFSQHNGKISMEEFHMSFFHYKYDLISGNVNQVGYGNGHSHTHQYRYDADNRITEVQTSKDGSGIWDTDARYFYYAHGPLARVEVGDLQVQGVDYVYNLQGWIKGVNSNTLDINRDPGEDSDPNGIHKHVAKDVYGYSLGYFAGDYSPINTAKTGTNSFYATLTGSDLEAERYNLYNGNIGSMVSTITNPSTRDVLPQGTAYKYDQLNRLRESKAFTNIDVGDNEWQSGSTYLGRYQNQFSYDANGNILSQLRKDGAGADIDELTYRYAKDLSGSVIQNRLYHVNDAVNPADYSDDIDDMDLFEEDLQLINTDNNYGYTEMGELKFDRQEEIAEIQWRVDGKVKAIIRPPLSTKKNLRFDYDPFGKRVSKHIYDSDDNWEKSIYYMRDAQGNVMAVYEYTVDEVEETESFKLKELHLYGSARLGIESPDLELIGYEPDYELTSRTLGYKQYELSNHLGNVLSVVSDKKIPQDSDTDQEVDGYLAHILSATDYSPFGVTLDDRNFSGGNYRYGFNGMEKDDQVKGDANSYDFGARFYDSRVGRWLSIDAFSSKYPYLSTYSSYANNPLIYLDVNGDYLDPANEAAQVFIDKTADKFAKAFTFEPIGSDKTMFTITENFESFKQFQKHLKKEKVTYTAAEEIEAFHFYQLVKEPKRIEVQIATIKTPSYASTREFIEGKSGSKVIKGVLVTENTSYSYFVSLLNASKDGLTPGLGKYLYEDAPYTYQYTNPGETEEKTYPADKLINVVRGEKFAFFPEENPRNQSTNSGMLLIDGTEPEKIFSNLVNGVSAAQKITLENE